MRKLTSILLIMLLLLSFSVVMAVPAAAAPPTGYTFVTMGTGVAELSNEQAHSGVTSAKLATVVGNTDGGYVRFEFAPGALKLDDLNQLSYWEYISARDSISSVDVFIDIWLDYNGDGVADSNDYNGYLQAEPYYTLFSPGKSTLNTWIPIDAMNLMWSTYVGPDAPYEGPTIANFQGTSPYSPGPHSYTMNDWTGGVDFGDLDILRIDVRVGYGGTWNNFTGYTDDIRINSYTQGFEPPAPAPPVVVGGEVYPVNKVVILAPYPLLAALAIIAFVAGRRYLLKRNS